MTTNDQITRPNPDNTAEWTLEQHVAQSTAIHVHDWHELDHADYLISEVGFDGEYVKDNMESIIQTMIRVRSEVIRERGLRP